MEEEHSVALRAIAIGICIGVWGIISGITGIVSGESGGESSLNVVAMLITYSLMMTALPVFILVGAYASSSLGKDQGGALGSALGSTIIGFALATMNGLAVLVLAMNANDIPTDGVFDLTLDIIQPLILALCTGILAALFRILSSTYDNTEELDELYKDEIIEKPPDSQPIDEYLASTVSGLEHRINTIESLVSSDRFNQLIYGKR